MRRILAYSLIFSLYACGSEASFDSGATSGGLSSGVTNNAGNNNNPGNNNNQNNNNNSGNNNNPGNNNPGATNPHMAALDGLSAKIESIPPTTVQAFQDAVLDWLRGRSEFSAFGVIAEDGSIWARFTDGRLIVIDPIHITETPVAPKVLTTPEQGEAQDRSPVLARFLPAGSKFALLGDTRHFSDAASTQNILASKLGSRGYFGVKGKLTLATLRSLNAADYGILYLDCHGGSGALPDNSTTFFIGTETARDEAAEEADLTLKGDLDDGSVIYKIVPHLSVSGGSIDNFVNSLNASLSTMNGQFRAVGHYGVSSKFISKYIRLRPGSLVFVNGCHGFGASSTAFRQAFTSGTVKGEKYLSWTQSVDSKDAPETALFLFDRLLGESSEMSFNYQFEEPFQRPFPLFDVLLHMRTRTRALGRSLGLTLDKSTYHSNSGDKIATLLQTNSSVELAPTIREIAVENSLSSPKLRIRGNFGDNSDNDGRVLFQGQELELAEPWNELGLVCDLPGDSTSGGSVEVQVGNHKSNKVMLTEYRMLVRTTQDSTIHRARQQYIQDMNYHATANFEVHFRAQGQDYRTKPGEQPTTPVLDIGAAKSSKLTSFTINYFEEAYYDYAPQLTYFIRQTARRNGPFGAADLATAPNFFGISNLDRTTKQFSARAGVADGVLTETWQSDDPDHRFTNHDFQLSVVTPVPLKLFQKGQHITFADGTTTQTVHQRLGPNETGTNTATITLTSAEVVSGAPDETGGI